MVVTWDETPTFDPAVAFSDGSVALSGTFSAVDEPDVGGEPTRELDDAGGWRSEHPQASEQATNCQPKPKITSHRIESAFRPHADARSLTANIRLTLDLDAQRCPDSSPLTGVGFICPTAADTEPKHLRPQVSSKASLGRRFVDPR